MSNSTKKMRKDTVVHPKNTYEENYADLNNQIAKANEIIGLFDKLLVNSARKKIGASEYNNLLSELLFRATTCSNLLKQYASDTIKNKNNERTDDIISVLGKLHSKVAYYPKTYEEACELGCVITLKDKIRTTLRACKLEDSIENLCEKYRAMGMSEDDIEARILNALDHNDKELLKVYENISPCNKALNTRKSEIDEKIGCTNAKTRESIKHDIEKTLNNTPSECTIVALRTALAALSEIETEDEEFYKLLSELRMALEKNEDARIAVEKHLIQDVPAATGIVLDPENTALQSAVSSDMEKNEDVHIAAEKDLIKEVPESTEPVLSTNLENNTLINASINRETQSPVTRFKNAEELGRLRSIRGKFYNNMASGGLFTVSSAIMASTLAQPLTTGEFAIGTGALVGCAAAGIVYFTKAYKDYKTFTNNDTKQL